MIGCGSNQRFPDLEQAIYNWLLECRKKIMCFKYVHIRAQARRYGTKLNFDVADFKFSYAWITYFCRRFCLSSRCQTHQAQENLKSASDKM